MVKRLIMKRISFFVSWVLITILIIGVSLNSFSQDSLSGKYFLVVEKRVTKPGKINISDTSENVVSAHIFSEGCKVAVKTAENNYYVGKIKNISDSSIVIKEHSIKIDQIRMICVYRGVEPTALGLSLVGGGFLIGGLIMAFSGENEYGNNYGWVGAMLSIAAGIFVGGGTTLFGIIEMSTTRHYSMKKKYFLDVRSFN